MIPATTSDTFTPGHRLVSGRLSVVFTRFDPDHDTLPSNAVRYRARAGAVFTFTPVRLPSGRYRAYIRDQPSYHCRSRTLHDSHRLYDRHGFYVCWMPEPESAEDLLRVMRVWAETTVVYLETGAFEAPR